MQIMNKFNQLNAFIQVVEQGSFRAAAKQLKITPAAVTQQIQQLESSLNIELLKRNTRSLELSTFGQSYYEQCKQVLAELANLNSLTTSYHKEPSGTLRITYGNYFGERFIVPNMKKFLIKYPKIKLDLVAGEHYENLITNDTDILFGMIAPAMPNWIQRRVLSTRYVICATKEYFAKYGTPQTPNDLYQHRYITHSRRTPPINALYFNNHQTILLQPIISIDDGRDMIGLGRQSAGLIKAPDFMIESDLKSGGLIEVLKSYCIMDVPVYLYYLQSKHTDPKIRCFIDFMFGQLCNG